MEGIYRMRRVFLSFLAFVLLLPNVFSSTLMMIDMDSNIYSDMEDLYILEGKASPMGAKPWSELDVQHLLDRIDPKTDMGKVLKERIESELSEKIDEARFEFSATIEPNIIYHTNENLDKSDDILLSNTLDRKLLNLGIGFSYSDNIALFMNASLSSEIADIEYITLDENTKRISNKYVTDVFSSQYASNIPFLPGRLDSMNFPDRAYFVLGFDAFRLYAGKDRIEWGNGVMGNMLLGDTLPFHNMLSMSFTGSKWFNYQMLVDFFTPFENLYGEGGAGDRGTMNGIRFLLAHRFEFSLFSGKLQLALIDSIMYASNDMYIDPQVLNPMAFLHNGYIAGHSNSFAAMEIEYAPVNNFSIYAQFGLDDWALPGEPQPPNDGATANAFGIMGGLRFRQPLAKGYLHGNMEIVYTSPFIYHRANGNGTAGGYDFSFISSIRYRDQKNVSGIYRYLSFPFGSDAIASLLSVGYKKPGVFDVTGNMFVLAHGVIDKFSVTSWYGETNKLGNGELTTAPSTINPFDKDESGEIEYTFALGAEVEYSPLSWLDLNFSAYLVSKANLHNKAYVNCYDLQLSFGASIKY